MISFSPHFSTGCPKTIAATDQFSSPFCACVSLSKWQAHTAGSVRHAMYRGTNKTSESSKKAFPFRNKTFTELLTEGDKHVCGCLGQGRIGCVMQEDTVCLGFVSWEQFNISGALGNSLLPRSGLGSEVDMKKTRLTKPQKGLLTYSIVPAFSGYLYRIQQCLLNDFSSSFNIEYTKRCLSKIQPSE